MMYSTLPSEHFNEGLSHPPALSVGNEGEVVRPHFSRK
jgi:hypothetical protein